MVFFSIMIISYLQGGTCRHPDDLGLLLAPCVDLFGVEVKEVFVRHTAESTQDGQIGYLSLGLLYSLLG